MDKRMSDYMNDFMYFIVRPFEDAAMMYCSGVNISRFTPLTAGKHRLGQNIVMKGLQSSNIELRSFILSRGGQPKTIRGGSCDGEQPRSHDDLWNSESLLIENIPADLTAAEVVMFSVQNFLKIVLPQCVPPEEIPKDVTVPANLQSWLDSLCKR
ncbi:MAG: hypothetical protein L7F77_04500 [Candidatus Magnetominusculus sp. LBB02]|nr:hypothetical protein [Candidatus Magnetominusculus sp. LBB02]